MGQLEQQPELGDGLEQQRLKKIYVFHPETKVFIHLVLVVEQRTKIESGLDAGQSEQEPMVEVRQFVGGPF